MSGVRIPAGAPTQNAKKPCSSNDYKVFSRICSIAQNYALEPDKRGENRGPKVFWGSISGSRHYNESIDSLIFSFVLFVTVSISVAKKTACDSLLGSESRVSTKREVD